MNISEILSHVDLFINSDEYKHFIDNYKLHFNVKADAIGVNLDRQNNIISVKKYLSFDKEKFTQKSVLIPKIPFIESILTYCNNTYTSPCIGLKKYNSNYRKYFHIKCNNEIFLNNLNFFKTNDYVFNSKDATMIGLSFEEKSIIKYFYFKNNLQYLSKFKKISQINNFNSLNNIEFVKYKNKSKIIISSSQDFNKNLLYTPFKETYNIDLRGLGYDSEGNSSYYFFK